MAGGILLLGLSLFLCGGCSGEAGRGGQAEDAAVANASADPAGEVQHLSGSAPEVKQEQQPSAGGGIAGARGESESGDQGGIEHSAAQSEAAEAQSKAPMDSSAVALAGEEESSQGLPEIPLPDLPPAYRRPEAPDLVLTDMSGREITLKDLQGQVVLANFWATWCPPCKKEIPQLVHLQETYGESGLKILGISLDPKGLATVKPFVRGRREINYTIIPSGQRAAQAFGGVTRIPTTFLLDKQGKIIGRFKGLPQGNEMEAYVRAALNE